MSIRLIIKQHDEGAAMHVGGPVHESYQTFEVDLPEVERFLRETPRYMRRTVIGAEVPPKETPDER